MKEDGNAFVAPGSWICCQLGAREHYAIPRSLHRSGALRLLITDAWAGAWLPWKLASHSRAAERWHPDVPPAFVESFDWRMLGFELQARRRWSGWELTMARNEWFQRRAITALRSFRDRNRGNGFTLFSYSYAARDIFQFARDCGWSTVLGQIDPGPFEERIVMDLHGNGECAGDANPAPPAYWDAWRNECRLAERIVVNSDWSRRGLLTEGVPAEKIHVVPLAYDPPAEAATFVRKYPAAFDFARPLRILFLGQVNVRKGLFEILGAVSRLEKRPVELWIVGAVQSPVPPGYERHSRVKWFGAVPRSAASRFYRDADVFLFPTFSDGFGLTQLEAQAWSLPVIASRRCGDVVEQGVNGYLLPEVSAESIASAIEDILAAPAVLGSLAAHSRRNEFTLEALRSRLGQMVTEGNSCCNR